MCSAILDSALDDERRRDCEANDRLLREQSETPDERARRVMPQDIRDWASPPDTTSERHDPRPR